MKIRYFNRPQKRWEYEQVYGNAAVHFLYNTRIGRYLADWICGNKWFSILYGALQSSFWSKRKIRPFVKKFGIDLNHFQPEKGRNEQDPYSSFNGFFIRKFKPGQREFISNTRQMPAFCEARYYGYSAIDENQKVPIKGIQLESSRLLENPKWTNIFANGPLFLARLCPVDYHRFHFPDTGRILDHYKIKGNLHSVNPMALAKKNDIFLTNERHVTILETTHFGKLAYIEIGAVCVGRIVQTFQGTTFLHGQEKGYFLFGGSSVVVIGTPSAWNPASDILENTSKGFETYIHLGDALTS